MVNLEPSRRSASLRLCFKNERVKTVEQWGKLYPAFTLAIAETALEMAKLGYGFRAVRMSPGASDNWLLGWMLVITSPTKYGAAEWQSTVLLDPDGNMWLQNFAPDERDLCSPSVQLIRINRFKAGDWNRWLENVLELAKQRRRGCSVRRMDSNCDPKKDGLLERKSRYCQSSRNSSPIGRALPFPAKP